MALTVQLFPDAHTQKDGSRYVWEVFSDAQGEVLRRQYLLAPGDDAVAIANARMPRVLNKLIANELRDAVQNDIVPAFRFATPQQMADFIAEHYPQLKGEVKARFCWWLNHRLVNGDVTDAQMMNLFTLTQPQWNARKTEIETLAASYEAVQSAA